MSVVQPHHCVPCCKMLRPRFCGTNERLVKKVTLLNDQAQEVYGVIMLATSACGNVSGQLL